MARHPSEKFLLLSGRLPGKIGGKQKHFSRREIPENGEAVRFPGERGTDGFDKGKGRNSRVSRMERREEEQ